MAGDAVRLAQRQRRVAGGEGQRLAVHLVGGAAVELEIARQGDRVGAALLHRLADVERFEPGEHVDVLEHLAADRAEQPAALGGGELAPRAGERRPRRGDGGIDVGGTAASDRRERTAVGRVLERQRAGGGSAPLAADQEAIGGKGNRRGRGRHGARSGPPRAALRHHKNLFDPHEPRAISLFLAKRFASLLLTLLAASAVVFTVLDVLPGNAAEVMLGESATPESVAALSARLGLDRPPLVRYADWMKGLVTGELGTSIAYDTPIAQLVGERLVVTVPLALMAMTLTTLLAFSLGLFAAARHGRVGDVGVMSLSQVGIALPNFWFAILLIWLFAVKLRWFSAGGFPGWSAAEGGGLGAGLRALVLPAIALAVVQAAILARIVRSAVLDVLREDFVRTARAKGQSPRGVLWGHVLRNAMVPVLTVMGLQFANLLTGTVVIENVFSLPGLGRLVFQAIANRDLPVVRNVVMLLAAAVVVINFAVDVLYVVIDPRLRARARTS